jgi:hypothetical protein
MVTESDFIGAILYTVILAAIVTAYIVMYWMVVFLVDVTKFDQVLVKLWPFGKWDIMYVHNGETHVRDMPSRKELIIKNYFRYFKSEIIETSWVVKVGGFLDGVKFAPRPRKRKK